jgi:hypothetical protein
VLYRSRRPELKDADEENGAGADADEEKQQMEEENAVIRVQSAPCCRNDDLPGG